MAKYKTESNINGQNENFKTLRVIMKTELNLNAPN